MGRDVGIRAREFKCPLIELGSSGAWRVHECIVKSYVVVRRKTLRYVRARGGAFQESKTATKEENKKIIADAS